MDCSFGSSNQKCAILFTGNNYADGGKTITFEGSSNFNSKVTFPNDYANGGQDNGAFVGYRLHLNNCFRDCYKFNQPVIIPNCVDDCSNMFRGCNTFNREVTIPNTVINCRYMFADCSNFNYPINILYSNVDLYGMYYGMFSNTPFNQDLYLPDADVGLGIEQHQYSQILNNATNYKSVVTCCPNMNYFGEGNGGNWAHIHGVVIYDDNSRFAGKIAANNSDVTFLGIVPNEGTYGAKVIFPYYDNAEIQVGYYDSAYRWVAIKNGSLPKVDAFR